MTTMVMKGNGKAFPSQERISGVADTFNSEEIYGAELHLCYPTCRYARYQQSLNTGNARFKFL